MTHRTLSAAERAAWAAADKSNETLQFNRTQQDAGWSDELDEPQGPSWIVVIVGAFLLGVPTMAAFLFLALSGAGLAP